MAKLESIDNSNVLEVAPKAPFLYHDIDEDLHIEFPDEMGGDRKPDVCNRNRSL
ncbi:hypothetical protein EV178_004151 [Coemansia sp. RSA 1646]|nr:hypothetical protein EV178_004151 [Coemansia sp. RSA 1646]